MQTDKSQKSSLQKVVTHPYFTHYVLYAFSFMILGQVVTCLGPMFPYLSAYENRLETQYSLLFLMRALGFMLGSVLINYVGQKMSLHQSLALGAALMGVFSMLFNTTSNLYIKGCFVFFTSLGGVFHEIVINLVAIDCFKGENMGMWLQSLHGWFGIGGLIGPFVVYIFQLNALLFLGIISSISLVFYFILPTPQKKVDAKKNQEEDKKIVQLPKLSLYLIASGFLLAVGQQSSYGGWISSYAVMWGFSTKEHAIFYSSVYWISLTLFRFVLALVPGPPSAKLRNLGIIGIFTSFIGVFLIFHVHVQFGLIVSSILFGFTNSVLFPLLLTVPGQYGYKLTIKQSTIFIIWGSLGDGCLAVGVGKMMEWFSYNWLQYGMSLMNIILVINITINSNILSQHRLDQESGDKLEKLLNNQETIQRPEKIKLSEMKQIS